MTAPSDAPITREEFEKFEDDILQEGDANAIDVRLCAAARRAFEALAEIARLESGACPLSERQANIARAALPPGWRE